MRLRIHFEGDAEEFTEEQANSPAWRHALGLWALFLWFGVPALVLAGVKWPERMLSAALVFLALLVVLIVVQVLVLLVLAAKAMHRHRLAERRWLERLEGETFVAATSRAGWYEFTRNNLIPALPTGVQLVWVHGRPKPAEGTLDPTTGFPFRAFHGVSLPALVTVRDGRLFGEPLHERLRPHRDRAARDEALQATLASLVEGALRRLDARARAWNEDR